MLGKPILCLEFLTEHWAWKDRWIKIILLVCFHDAGIWENSNECQSWWQCWDQVQWTEGLALWKRRCTRWDLGNNFTGYHFYLKKSNSDSFSERVSMWANQQGKGSANCFKRQSYCCSSAPVRKENSHKRNISKRELPHFSNTLFTRTSDLTDVCTNGSLLTSGWDLTFKVAEAHQDSNMLTSYSPCFSSPWGYFTSVISAVKWDWLIKYLELVQ